MMNLGNCRRAGALIAALIAGPLLAQGTETAFGADGADPDAPVEVTADSLSVDQETGIAVFTGAVTISQDTMRLSASEVRVVYTSGGDRIERLEATGGVTLVSGDDAAEAERADYEVEAGRIRMSGEVLLTRGQTIVAAERMNVDLDTGRAELSGRVRTVLQPGDAE